MLMLSTGMCLVSKSGRRLSPVPKIAADTDRKLQNTLKRLDAWLVKEAAIEAEAEGPDPGTFQSRLGAPNFRTTLMRALDPKRLSPADRAQANLILFGDEDGPTASNLVEADHELVRRAA